MNDRIKAALSGILEKFKSGDIPQAIALSLFPVPNIPSAQWSLINRTLMYLSGTKDARGFRQWQQAGRQVKKGAKAVTIFAPRIIRRPKEDGEDIILTGFLAVPVFRVEDTEGEPLDYQPSKFQTLPLKAVAERWGISLKAIPPNQQYYGYYEGGTQEIALATEDESVFFHELAHAAHHQVGGELKDGQDPLQEIVAELAAETLCQVVGRTSRYLGNSYRYIESYAKKLEISPLTACVKVMGEVEQVLNLILSSVQSGETLPEAVCARTKEALCDTP